MKQVSISISDLAYRMLIQLSEVSGKSQSAICAPYIEKALADEMRELKQQLDLLSEMGDMKATDNDGF